MQVFWLAYHCANSTFPRQSPQWCLFKTLSQAPRLQRRDRAGFSPASLLAAYWNKQNIKLFIQLKRQNPLLISALLLPYEKRQYKLFVICSSAFMQNYKLRLQKLATYSTLIYYPRAADNLAYRLLFQRNTVEVRLRRIPTGLSFHASLAQLALRCNCKTII